MTTALALQCKVRLVLYKQNALEKIEIIKQTKWWIFTWLLFTTLFVYAVSLFKGLKSGGTLHIMSPSKNVGSCPRAFPWVAPLLWRQKARVHMLHTWSVNYVTIGSVVSTVYYCVTNVWTDEIAISLLLYVSIAFFA